MRALPRVSQGGRRRHRHGGLLSIHVAIVSTGHDVADARLHRTAAALLRAGATVEVHGLGDPAQGPEGCQVVAHERGGMFRRLRRALAWPFRVDADVLVTIDPDTSPAALVSSRLRRRKWVSDVHEDYAALLKDRAWVPKPLLGILRAGATIMGWLSSRADMVIVADEHLPPRKARNRMVMRNEPDFSHLPGLRDPEATGPWRAVYIGDNRTSRGLRTMVEAVAATADDPQPWSLDIVGPMAAAERKWFDQRLVQGDAQRVTWHGRHEPAASWAFADGADVGLCLLEETPAFSDAMPSKVYEYLACGIPTVATPLPRVAELLSRTGAGVIVHTVEETTVALRRFAEDADFRAELSQLAREAGEVARSRHNIYDDAAARIVALAG